MYLYIHNTVQVWFERVCWLLGGRLWVCVQRNEEAMHLHAWLATGGKEFAREPGPKYLIACVLETVFSPLLFAARFGNALGDVRAVRSCKI